MRDGNRLLLMRVPPGPPDGPLSQLSRLRRDFLGYLLDAAKYGDLVRLRPAPGAVIWLVNHPALVQDILVTRADKFHKSAMTRRMVGKFLGQGLVLSEGGLHRRQRGLMQPAFGSRRLAAAVPLVAGLAQRMVSQWRQNQLIDCDAEMTRLTLGVMTQTLFGVEGTG
ncbi:MAG: cytochrome P450, partial [Stenotrophobium sp.]